MRCEFPTQRFVDNGDGTVTDNHTGLQWEKKTGTYSRVVDCHETTCSDPHNVNNTYQWCLNANDDAHCDHPGQPPDGGAFTDFLIRLNTAPCFAGHCDWRLPSEEGANFPYAGAKELESILLTPAPCDTRPCIDPVFGPTAESAYWSATTIVRVDNPTGAWIVSFDHGSVNYSFKDLSFHVRAVRTGP